MASILNNTTRKYSLAYGYDKHGQTLCLKVMPGHLTFEKLQRQQKSSAKLNRHIGTEKDFEDVLEELSKIDYVKVLCDLGLLVLSTKRNLHVEESEEKPKPVKRRKSKKTVEAEMKGPFE